MAAPLLAARLASKGGHMSKFGSKFMGSGSKLSNFRSKIAEHKRKGSITPILILAGLLIVGFAIYFALMAKGVVSSPLP